MNNENNGRESYYNLFASNIIHYIVFLALVLSIIASTFYLILPYIDNVIVGQYLEGEVIDNGIVVRSDEIKVRSKSTQAEPEGNFYTHWKIKIYKGSDQEADYGFNPVLSLLMPVTLFSILLSLFISSLLPIKLGLMRHKIEREIFNVVDHLNATIDKKDFYQDKNIEDILIEANTLTILNLADEWEIPAEDLQYIQAVLMWQRANPFARIISSWKALRFYLRFYFTDKYSNVVLGLVYIGAAVLIIIIGMRGLKFIPANQPSLIFFALGLEFTVLLTYAFTVIYSRSDSESSHKSQNTQPAPLLSNDFGNSKEVENLLRAFLRESKSNIKN